MTGDQEKGAFVPPIEELSPRTDEDVARALNCAACRSQSLAVAGLEQLATGNDVRIAVAAARALGLVRDVTAADALARVRGSAQDRSVRKEAGRSLHRLGSAGIEPATRPLGADTWQTPRLAGSMERAVASWYDPSGDRLMMTAVRTPGGRLLSFAWVLDESAGIDRLRAVPTSRREFTWRVERLRAKEELVDIDAEHARFLIKEAADITHEVGGSIPDDYAVYRDAIKGMGAPPEHPIIYEKMNPDEIARDREALAASGLIPHLPECQWGLDEDKMAPYRERARAAVNGVIVTSEAVRVERVERIIRDIIAQEISRETLERYRRRLEETAYILLLKGRDEQARAAFAAALAIAAGRPAREVPFVRELAARSAGLVDERLPEGRELARLEAERDRDRLVRPPFEIDPRHPGRMG